MSRRFLLLIAFIVVAAALLFVPLPIPASAAGRTIEDAGHVPLFLLGTLLVLAMLRNEFRIEGARLYALAGLIGAGAGFLSEVIQKPLHRDASWDDVLSDVMGVLLALALYALFDRRTALPRAARIAIRAVAGLVVAVCALMYLAPIANMVRGYLHRDAQFPVLARFDSSAELYWIVGYGVNRGIRDGALDVEFDAEQFPGFSFHEPVPDWRRFRTLVIDLENPEHLELELGVRIHDIGHGREYGDRFNRRFELGPAERRELRIPLDEVRRGPRNRLMNMAQISDVTLFRLHESASQHMRLHSMWLE